jgi:hypothetical protein
VRAYEQATGQPAPTTVPTVPATPTPTATR